MAERVWQPGQTGKTAQGEYKVIRATKEGYLVEYLKGPWEGKHIVMPRTVGRKSETLEGLKLKREEKEKLLDIFYHEFSNEFNHIFSMLGGNRGEAPTTDMMLAALREYYPPLFQMALNTYFQQRAA